MATRTSSQIDSTFRQHIESKYSPIPRDDHEKLIDALLGLMEYGRDRRQSLHSFFEQVTRLIFRFFAFDQVAVGLYDRKQKDYYVDVTFGYRDDLAAEYKKVRYDYDDMVSQDRFPNIKIGKISELNPIEGLPEDERRLFNRPYAVSAARQALDQFHEGDYIDVWMMGPQKNIIGWLELSNPRDGKLPSRMTVMWAEIIASVCAYVIRRRWFQEDQARS